MKKVRFIYNPSSGDTLISEWLDEVIAMYQDEGFAVEIYRLSFHDRNEDVALEGVGQEHHHILVAGGDGTINYVVNVMKRMGLDVPLAILPIGTSNDFAKMLGMKDEITKACRQILSGEIHRIDLGKANDEYFINVFSCGLFTDVSQKTPTFLKNNFGKLAYYFEGLGELPNFRKMHISIEAAEGNYEGPSLIFFVFNGQTAGQFKLAYQSKIDDGLLDVLVVKGDNPRETMGTVLHFLKRTPDNYPAGIVHFKSKELAVYSTKDETTDIDGQPGPDFPVRITCEKNALSIIRPKNSGKQQRRYDIYNGAQDKYKKEYRRK